VTIGGARAVRALVAALALACLAAPAWPQQIDDQMITLAFARAWAETGLIQWNTGAVVEACSSALQLSLATVYLLAGGPDANMFVKVLALLAGLATVVFASFVLPMRRSGHLLLAALVVWEPLAWWSAAGMETTLTTLLLAVGWTTVGPGLLRPPASGRGDPSPLGLGALLLAATSHPEGNLHFVLGAAVAWWSGMRWRWLLGFGAALALYHVWRITTYGAVLPTPWLVKIASNPSFGGQWEQVGWSLLSAGGIAAAALAFRGRPLALVPLAVQLVLALRAEADWMGHARHLLPGVVASALMFARGEERAVGRVGWLVLPLALAGGAVASPGLEGLQRRALVPVLTPLQWYGAALDTTQLEDVAWMVENAPTNGTVITEDVGMPGNIPGIRVLDLVGLTDRDVALASAGDEAAYERIATRLQGPPDRPALVRRMRYGGEGTPRPIPWLKLPEPTTRSYPQGTALWYRMTETRPSPQTIAWRWALLHQHFPSQGPVAWYHAMAEADLGRLAVAARVADEMRAQFPRDPVMEALGAALYASFSLEDFDTIPSVLRQVSRPIPKSEAPKLLVDVSVSPSDGEGQLVVVRWSCMDNGDSVVIKGDERIALPTWTCPGEEATLVTEVLDDRPRRPLARSLYVALGAR
jgi:hypothetical protein